MAGVLDFLNSDDAKLGLAMLAAAGPSAVPASFGQRLQGAMQGLAAEKQNTMKMGLLQAQMDDFSQQAKLRGQQAANEQQLNDWLAKRLNGTAAPAVPAAPGQLGSGSYGVVAPAGGQPAIPQAPARPGFVGSLNPDDLAFLKLRGKDLTDVYKLTQPDMQVSNGYVYDKNKVQPGFLPGVNIANDGRGTLTMPGANGLPQMTAMPGSVDAYRQFENAKNDSAAGVKPIKVYNPNTQREEYRTEAEVTGRAQPAPQSGVQGNFTGDQASIIAAIDAIRDPQERANARAAFNEQAKRTPGFAGGAPFAAGMSTGESLSKEAGGEVNKSFIKTSYEPTLEAGRAANEMLTNVTVARNAMRAMGGTGWGTEAKANAASVLAGLGIAPANAKFYAANAETFQNVAMSNLATQLNAAKGPQTEGDATRVGKTFAQLKNTPQANEFILDLAEAKAQRDQMKAQFFQQALPVAQQKGDLAEVERAWSKRAPSVFSMSSMQKWNAK